MPGIMRRQATILAVIAVFVTGLVWQSDQQAAQGSAPTGNIFGDGLVTSDSTYIGPADITQQLPVALFLQRNESALDAYLQQVADPASANHRRFLSASAIKSRFGPTSETQQQVLRFMQGRGATLTIDTAGIFAHGQVAVGTLAQIFNTTFSQYSRSGQTFVAPTIPPTLPAGLQGAVTHVLGLSTEPSLLRTGKSVVGQNGSPTASGARTGCASALAKSGFTPSQIRTAYGIDTLRNAGLQGQGIYMALVEESGFLQSNIDQFVSCFGIANAVTPQVVTVGRAPTALSDEPHLDIEVILSVAPQISGLYVFQSQLNSNADWARLYAGPLNTANTGGNQVTILSSSLGKCELHWTRAGIDAMEKVLKSLAVAGVSVFTSAGDSGSSDCYHSDGVTKTKTTGYPATSAYVTAVGGTNLALSKANTIAGAGVWNESLWPSPYSKVGSGGGGGVSTMVSRPSWQTGTDQPGTDRTVPDVVMFADQNPGYVIYGVDKKDPSTNKWFDDGGTSAATPLFASGTALLHQKAAQQNTVLDLGYIWIYRLANNSANYQSAFYDITVGNNDIFYVGCCDAGVGYDMASGWGSVNFSVLATLLTGL
ncbi:MAG: protease pro-enzyme activation domain-containing protein [Nitrospiraceae bacterium]